MNLTYDHDLNIAYLRLKKKTAKVRTIAVSDELNIDLAPDGSVYGIELLNANAQLDIRRSKKITLTDATSGATCELPIAI